MRSAKLTVDEPIARAIPNHHLYEALSRETVNGFSEITAESLLPKAGVGLQPRAASRNSD
jgi:hypothetical protein